MNKLFSCPNLLEDEKLNCKIEKIFENKVFQKMVENTNVLEDAGLASTDDNDGSDDGFDHKKNILDMKAIEKSTLIAPYVPTADEPAAGKPEPEGNNQLRLRNFSKKPVDQHEDSRLSRESQAKRDKMESESFERQIQRDVGDLSDIDKSEQGDHQEDEQDNQQSESVAELIENREDEDQHEDDNDNGFELYEVAEAEFEKVSKHLAKEFKFPERAVKPGKKKKRRDNHRLTEAEIEQRSNRKNGYIFLPESVKHPRSDDPFYPRTFDKVVYDCFHLKVIYDRERTGFEETKEFEIVLGSVIAGRYQVVEYLGAAAFSKAIQCVDLQTSQNYCLKIIENNKDYFDQSIDEIKLLRYINVNGDVDQHHVLRVFDFFYHKEHLFIVTELLKDNLYEYYKFNREKENEEYFTVGRLQKITWQILQGLSFIHGLQLIHCDLKPENIMIKSYSRTEVKIIDFGSSCYVHDHLSSYVQSRSYRAPEVIIGCKYDYKIDMWSLGCILAELYTGSVLFQNETVQGLLARVIGILGPFPEWMMEEGKLVSKFFTKERLLYQDVMNLLI